VAFGRTWVLASADDDVLLQAVRVVRIAARVAAVRPMALRPGAVIVTLLPFARTARARRFAPAPVAPGENR
jgi:hypothetical protein